MWILILVFEIWLLLMNNATHFGHLNAAIDLTNYVFFAQPFGIFHFLLFMRLTHLAAVCPITIFSYLAPYYFSYKGEALQLNG